MRKAFLHTLLEWAEHDERVFLIVGDVGFSLVEPFAERFPSRFLNVGVAEQNMIGVATGIALSGGTAVVYSIANFPTLRCLEQIRNDVCYHAANVKIVAVGGGVAYGAAGFSHHAIEDLAIMRTMPNMLVVAPGDPVEVEYATRAIMSRTGPSYLRLGRTGEPRVHAGPLEFELGRGIVVRPGRDVTIISTGAMLHTTVQAAQQLVERGIDPRVLSIHTLKPFDAEMVRLAARETRAVITVEEHIEIGGLGSAVAEALCDVGPLGSHVKRVAIASDFIPLAGSQDYLRRVFGLSVEGVLSAVEPILAQLRQESGGY